MKVPFKDPYLDRDRGGHVFLFQDPPLFECVQDATAPFEISFKTDCSGQFLEFCSGFLKDAGQFFSKPLPVASFLERLTHEWDLEDIPAEEREFRGRAIVRWIPASVCFLKGRYVMDWNCVEIVPEMEPKEEVQIEEVQEVQEIVASGASGVTEGAEAVPVPVSLNSLPSLPIQPEANFREHWKQKVRKARLRAALAQLRAEKMAEKYYLHYGSLDLDESDSDLSYSELSLGEQALRT